MASCGYCERVIPPGTNSVRIICAASWTNDAPSGEFEVMEEVCDKAHFYEKYPPASAALNFDPNGGP